MKYYIPTSSLNLDNILQSECILPLSHYNQRISGYKYFEQIEELRSASGIVMFNYPVQFTINDIGRYNFPILIELEDDTQTSDIQRINNIEGGFQCTHEISLTPLNCRIYFFSERAYKLTIVNTQSNKAIKYFKDFNIKTNASQLKLRQMPRLEQYPPINISMFEDSFIDKQKGGLYAYLLGGQLSVSKNIAVQLRLSQEIYDILTNLISVPSNTSFFGEKLSNLIKEYSEVDIIEKKNQELFNKQFDNILGKRVKFLKGCLIDFLKLIDCWDVVYQSLCRRWNCDLLPKQIGLWTEKDFAELRNKIERRTNEAYKAHSSLSSIANLSNIHIVANNLEFSEAKLVNIAIKHIMKESVTSETLSANRLEFYTSIMTEIVSLLKNQMGETNWAESFERAYVNSLYNHIADPMSPFVLNSIDNIELKSIAAFILRGHSYKDLINYMKLSEMENYKYALSLWGVLTGYLEMNRDILSKVLSIDNYKMIYKKIYNRDMAFISSSNEPLTNIQPQNGNHFHEKDIHTKIINNIGQLEPRKKKQDNVIEAVIKAGELEESVQSPRAFMYIFDSFPHIKSTKAYKALVEADFENDEASYNPIEFKQKIYQIIGKEALKKQKQKIDKAIELEAKRHDPKAFLMILDNFLSPKESAYKRIASLLNIDLQLKIEVQEPTLFPNAKDQSKETKTNSLLFVFDNLCWYKLKAIIPDELHKNFRVDLEWFQNEYRKGNESQYYAHASRENTSSIDAFKRYLGKRKYASKLNIKNITDYLKQVYV